jgi:hypothetical protein
VAELALARLSHLDAQSSDFGAGFGSRISAFETCPGQMGLFERCGPLGPTEVCSWNFIDTSAPRA